MSIDTLFEKMDEHSDALEDLAMANIKFKSQLELMENNLEILWSVLSKAEIKIKDLQQRLESL